jgi:integrase
VLNLERRANRWYAVLVVPEDVRAAIGKFKFIQSTGTEDKRRAQAIAAPILAHWRALIRQARGEGDAVVREALRWREALGAEKDPDVRDVLEEQVLDRAEVIGAARSRELGRDHPEAQRFAEIAFGQSTPSSAHLEAWQSQLALAQKTQDQMQKDVALMLERFPTLEAITHQAVKGWLGELQTKGATDSTRARIVSCCRNYWRYLRHVDAVPAESDPFRGLSGGGGIGSKKKQNGSGRGWEPFKPADVVKLWKAAREEKDQQLADLIAVAAHSGARIEELCSLKVSAVTGSTFKITDAKTAAGVREVPIHGNLKGTVTRLRKAAKDGYLFSGLGANKYGDRSNAIGKRFGRLKASLAFGEHHVFHSIRKTFVTLLENAGVSENLAADIVGHEKPRVTYGLYSGGASVAVKAAAVEKVKYPGIACRPH